MTKSAEHIFPLKTRLRTLIIDHLTTNDELSQGWLLQHFMPSPHNPGHIQVHSFYLIFDRRDTDWLVPFLFPRVEMDLLRDVKRDDVLYSKNELKKDFRDVVNGDDQCGVLSLKNGSYSSVACDYEPEEMTRFICERTAEAHEEVSFFSY